MFSFSKWVSEWAFIFKMWFSFEMCFHFQNMKGFVIFVFPFSEKHNCKQKSVHSLQIALLMRLWTNNEIYIKLLNLVLLSRIYNLLYLSRNPIQIKANRAILFSRQTFIHIEIGINNDFFARIATCGTNGIFRPFTTSYAIFVAG